MPIRGEHVRFWGPVVLLGLMAAYTTQKLVRAHVCMDDDFKLPRYSSSEPVPALRGGIYSCRGKNYPFVKSIPCWEYRFDPVAVKKAKLYPPRDKSEIAKERARAAAAPKQNFFVRIWKRLFEKRAPKKKAEPRKPIAIVKMIGDLLGIEFSEMQAKYANQSNRYQRLAVSINPKVHDILTNRTICAGIGIEDTQVRQYFHKRQLCHVIGHVVSAEQKIAGCRKVVKFSEGQSGLEQRYNGILTGEPGVNTVWRDAKGNEIYDKRVPEKLPRPGKDIFLTVDPNIQFETEDAIKWGVAEFGAAAGWGVVMNARTGAVLAMASYPDFDPRDRGHAATNTWFNRAVTFPYEPGSVMKVITAAAAIDAGFVSPRTVYTTNRNDPRYYRLPDDHGHVWPPTMTVQDAIVKSSNIVIGKLGYDFGPTRLRAALSSFGFGKPSGVGLPGDSKGLLKSFKPHIWDKASWSRTAIGQGACAVTAIQMASAYQAIANDGVRMQPYIVDHIDDYDGTPWKKFVPHPVAGKPPIRADTSRTVRKMMLGVASPQGTARRAAIRGYSIAGKTGTAQKPVRGVYVPGLFRASFCGIVPSGVEEKVSARAELVILVTLDFEHKATFHQGGNSAGPVFRRIAMFALRYLAIPPDRPQELEEFEDDDEYQRIMEKRAEKYGNTL